MCDSNMINRLPKWDYMAIPVKIFRHRKYFENYNDIYFFRSLILTDYKTCSLSQLFPCYLSLRTSSSSSGAEPSPILLDGWWENTWIAKVGHKESIQKKVTFISLLQIVKWVFITFSCDVRAALNIGGQTFSPIVHLITLLREGFSLRIKMQKSYKNYFRWNIF